MRLSPREIDVIRSSVLKLDPTAKIYLYGSRTQDHLKGGDIDLLVISEHIQFSDRITILTDILFQIGEQKIDLLIQTRSASIADEFVQNILKSAILI